MSTYATIYVLRDVGKVFVSIDAAPPIYVGTNIDLYTLTVTLESRLVGCSPGTTDIQRIFEIPKEWS
jgi:hypothetical protein